MTTGTHILQNIPEPELLAGSLVPLAHVVWLLPSPPTRMTLDEARWPLSPSRPPDRRGDNWDQVLLSAECFHLSWNKTSVTPPHGHPNQWIHSGELDSPTCVTIEGEGSTFLERVWNCGQSKRISHQNPERGWVTTKGYTTRDGEKWMA